jgi:hypothetical protein
MKTISQTLIMSWLGKNYQWALVEGSPSSFIIGAPLSIVFNSLMCVVDMPIELNIFNISLSPSMINSAIPDFQQSGLGRFLLLFRSFEQSLYSSVSRSVQAGDSRAIQRLMLQVAGTMLH